MTLGTLFGPLYEIYMTVSQTAFINVPNLLKKEISLTILSVNVYCLNQRFVSVTFNLLDLDPLCTDPQQM